MTLAYTLHLLHASLSQITNIRLILAARSLVEKLSSAAPNALLPGETLIATISPTPTSRLLRTQQSVSALARVGDDVRIFSRLWGLLKIWSCAARLWRSTPKDRATRSILWTQVVAGFTLKYMENCAYLASKGVLGFSEKKIGRWYKWSARLWATHVLLELVRLARETAVHDQEGSSGDADGDEKEMKIAKAKQVTKWWRDVYVNVAWMPLTIHWSMERGFAGEGLIALLGWIPGVVSRKEASKDCA